MALTKNVAKNRDNRWYGWIPDLPDNRDKLFVVNKFKAKAFRLPTKMDLIGGCPLIYNQGVIGSCTGNAIAAAHQFLQKLQRKTDVFNPSRLFIYYNERAMEGTINSDSGAMIRDGIKSLNRQGVCPETEWPYDVKKFADKPPKKCYTSALNSQSVSYFSVAQDIMAIKTCLAEGFPIVFGFSVYTAFESRSVAESGILNVPTDKERLIGGHAVLLVGYDDSNQRVIVRNSWGNDWGHGGYFTMPYEYVTNRRLAADFWTIRSIE